jgi:hypothetical protein
VCLLAFLISANKLQPLFVDGNLESIHQRGVFYIEKIANAVRSNISSPWQSVPIEI